MTHFFFDLLHIRKRTTLEIIKSYTHLITLALIIINITLFVIIAVLSTSPHKFNIAIRTEEYDTETESNGLACQLVFTYTEKYPDTAPLVEIEDPVNFEDDYEEKLLDHIKETVCKSL